MIPPNESAEQSKAEKRYHVCEVRLVEHDDPRGCEFACETCGSHLCSDDSRRLQDTVRALRAACSVALLHINRGYLERDFVLKKLRKVLGL